LKTVSSAKRLFPGQITLATGVTCGLVSLLTACTAGPDFSTPQPVASNDQYQYTSSPVHKTVSAESFAGHSQKILKDQDIPGKWWEVFHSQDLDRLIRLALEKSPNLASAQAALRQAKENYTAQAGASLYPGVTANLGVQKERASAVSSGVPGGVDMNLYNASVNVSYQVDVFGANKRGLEALQAGVDYQRFLLEASYLTLTSNVVTTAIREASLRAQLKATEEILEAQQAQLQIVERQFKLGAIPKSSWLAQLNLITQTRASIPGLQKNLEQNRHLLAVLVGDLPGSGNLPEFRLESLTLPADLPLSIPSALVRQRPDIRATESLLHQASAQLGVATANQYPQLNLSASYGYTSPQAENLFNDKFGFWSVGAGLVAPIFNAGSLSAKRRAAEAAYDQAAAQYRATVLSAFQNVADSLRALEFDAQTLQQQANAEALARETLELVDKQYRLGGVSSLTLLDAKRTYYSARIALVQAQASRYADTAALFQSLGGGWWNRPELADISKSASSISQ